MDATRQAQVAFYLTGKRLGAALEPVEGLGLRPALMARYRDLAALRYDYPVVLVEGSSDEDRVRPLSSIVDDALRAVAGGEDEDRLAKQALRTEGWIRASVAAGSRRRLSELWAEAAARIVGGGDPTAAEGLERVRAALAGDGWVLDCDADLPARLLAHVWRATQESKAAAMARDLARLRQRVADILRADFARSERGRAAGALRAAVGGEDAEAIDFEAMSRVLVRTANHTTLARARRHRLERLIASLGSGEFRAETCTFQSCRAALSAWREDYPRRIEVSRAIAIAELETAGDYREDRHDPFFEDYAADGLAPEESARFPDYLVCANAAAMDADEQAALMEILSSGLPVKVLVQTDDLLGDDRPVAGAGGFGRSAPHLAHMAMGLNEVFVLQAPASHLPRLCPELVAGMDYAGAALFSVFSGASGHTGTVSPYLVAAAAAESRAFPIFAYDPAAGADWASRFTLGTNPQPEQDWPEHVLEYEGADRHRASESSPFTYVDFAALDARHARHLAALPGALGATVSAAEALDRDAPDEADPLPAIPMVDGDGWLHRVLVDEKLLREARRCRSAWRSLQALGGFHDSRAVPGTEPAGAGPAEPAGAGPTEPAATDAARPEAAAESTAVAGTEASPAPVPDDEPEPAHSPDEAWIETTLCTTCNECTQINDKMFAYNENRQAYIADPDAGTYAQLVEAAESCQVSIIHPGKPRNPGEPGLEELVTRAEPFL